MGATGNSADSAILTGPAPADGKSVAPLPGRAPWLLYAWLAVVAIPIFFLGAMAVGEGLYSLAGHEPGTDILPLGWDLLFSAVSLLVFLIPCVAAIIFARRAIRGGRAWGWLPLIIASVNALYLTVMTVGSLIAAQFL